MFQVLSIKRVPAGIEITVDYDMVSKPGEQKRVTVVKQDPRQASYWIEGAMKEYASAWLAKYIDHKAILRKTRCKTWPVTPERERSFMVLMQMKEQVPYMSVIGLAKSILQHEFDLNNILPDHTNNAYESSKWNIEKLILWAHEILYHRKEFTLD
jgi:hypothetical protein